MEDKIESSIIREYGKKGNYYSINWDSILAGGYSGIQELNSCQFLPPMKSASLP